VLIVTTLDWEALPNGFEHHRARHYAALGCRVSVLYKRLRRERGLRALLRDTFCPRVSAREEGGILLVALDPPFNYHPGLRSDAEESADPAAGPSPGLRAARLLSPLGLLRELAFVPWALFGFALKLRARQDVCLGVGAFGGLAGWLLRAAGRAEVFVYADRDYEPGLFPDRVRRAAAGAAERFCIRRADVLTCVGELLAELRRAQTGRRAELLPNGVDWERFAPARASRRRAGARLLYVGNVAAWSGLELAVAALPELARAHPDVRLCVAGDGLPGALARLRAQAASLGVAERVDFLGRRPPEELPELLAGADVGLAASAPVPFRRYAAPLKVMEYMAAGLPVLATEGTEAGASVARAGAGLAVPYDAASVERALARLLGDARLRAELGARGAEHSRGLDWRALVARELDLALARAGRRPAAAEGA
jgi:glycosyltransferase involved in cell wall biosynthesis